MACDMQAVAALRRGRRRQSFSVRLRRDDRLQSVDVSAKIRAHVDDPGGRWPLARRRASCRRAVRQSPKFAFTSAERRGVLESNGLRFVIMPDTTTQLAEVDIRYDVGAREDPPGKAGLAHLVEHMMFQTASRRSEDAADLPDDHRSGDGLQRVHELGHDALPHDVARPRTSTRCSRSRRCACTTRPMPEPFGCSTVRSEFEREREVVRNEIRARSSAEGLRRPARRGDDLSAGPRVPAHDRRQRRADREHLARRRPASS